MFTIKEKQEIRWPVSVMQPNEKVLGKNKKQVFNIKIDYDALVERRNDLFDFAERDLSDLTTAERVETVRQKLEDTAAAVIIDWDDVVEGEGRDAQPIPYSVDLLRSCMRDPRFQNGVMQALREVLTGEDQRRKN